MAEQPNETAAMQEPTDELRCPFLGLAHDGDTWYTVPTQANYCHKALSPQPINVGYQAQRCLSGEFHQCPVFQDANPKWTGPLPVEIRGQAPVFASKEAS